MSIRTPLRSLLLALAVTIAAGAALAGPAAAKNRSHPIYNDNQGWAYVDQNRDGAVSKSEWKWAEKNGYDRLNGVPKSHLTRSEYQRYLTAYLESRSQRNWRNAGYWDRQRGDNWGNDNWRDNGWRRYDQNPYQYGQPDYDPDRGGGKH